MGFQLLNADQLLAEATPCPITGCWWWSGGLTRGGYGQLRHRGATGRYAHREMYFVTHGTHLVPDDVVMHLCDNPSCINPEHLRLGTNLENIRDMLAKGRHGNARKTACCHGHPFTPRNTRVELSGRRQCRECERLRSVRRTDQRRLNRTRRPSYTAKRASLAT